MSKASPALPEIFFDHMTGNYWIRLESTRFIQLDKSSVKLHLRRAGLSDDNVLKGIGLGEVENHIYLTQTKRAVDWSGPLAGHACGLLKAPSGDALLVTSEARPVAAKAGKLPALARFFEELLGNQRDHVFHWLKFAREALLAGDFRPGQLLVLAGPSGCGKSLLQALVTEFLGGRSAKPYRYMSGEDKFNGELAGAEHLVIEDEAASHDIRKRRLFGTKLKEMIVNVELSFNPKGRQAVKLPSFRRLTLSVNNEPENLMILPPLDPSILDKVSLLVCDRAELPTDRKATWSRFMAELPALAAFCEKLTVPRELRCPRYGVTAFHNPLLLAELSDIAPETHLLRVIDDVLFGAMNKDNAPWKGSAQELELELRGSDFRFAVERLAYTPSIVGVYLARLAVKQPERFRQTRSKGSNKWTITAP